LAIASFLICARLRSSAADFLAFYLRLLRSSVFQRFCFLFLPVAASLIRVHPRESALAVSALPAGL
jgi:hypothetical protein